MKISKCELYNGYSVNTGKDGTKYYYPQILDKYHAHLQDMVDRHSKVMQVRFDLRYPADGSVTPTPEHLYSFSKNITRDLTRNAPLSTEPGRKQSGSRAHQVDPRLIRVTEHHGGSPHPHTHGLLLVNANAKISGFDVLQRVERQWKNALGVESASGLVDYCSRSGPNPLIIKRYISKGELAQAMNAASHQASYLAKTRGKDSPAKGAWLVSSSRLPKKCASATGNRNTHHAPQGASME